MSSVLAEACIARTPLFRSLDDVGRRRLAAVAVVQDLAAGEVLLRQGDTSDAVYLAVRGLLRVEAAELEPGQRVATLEPGALVGEIGVLTKETRSTTVVAETDAQVLRFGRLGMANVLRDYPKVLAEMHRLGGARTEDLLGKMLD